MNIAARNNSVRDFDGLDFFLSQRAEKYKQSKCLNSYRDISSSGIGVGMLDMLPMLENRKSFNHTFSRLNSTFWDTEVSNQL